MGKKAPAAKPATARHERAARAANRDRNVKPANLLESNIARWKDLHIVQTRAEIAIEVVKGEVKTAMVELGVDHISTPFGTPSLQQKAGRTDIDWEALARANVDQDVIERELPRYTKVGAPSVALLADRAWTLEAKSKPA